jgi:hypothetical protein
MRLPSGEKAGASTSPWRLERRRGGFAVEMRKIDVGLAAEIGAIGEEGERGGVGRPDEVTLGAALVRCGSGGDALAGGEVVDGSDANLAAEQPSDALAIGGKERPG